MKRIAVFCDGTWARLDAPRPTNVARLAMAIPPEAPDGTVQLVVHLDGVGTGRGATGLARRLDRLAGGLMGLGLDEAIAEAFRLLVFAYRPGDEIYVFGYSRGAYTARSLVGLLRNCGILSRAGAGRVGEALALYRSRAEEDRPDGARSLAFRADHASAVTTGDDELAWRRQARPGIDWSGAVPLRIAYLGVWDTVGALGVPATLTPTGLLNRRHTFHDTALSSRVRAARHAVAIDERRRSFVPALWDNVAELNGADGSGPDAAYQQRWFPGVHGAVGGGGADEHLSNAALLWVLEGAERQGLHVDRAARDAIAAGADPVRGRLDAGKARGGLRGWALNLRPADRAGPVEADELAEATRARWRADAGYRPGPLARLAAALDAD